MQVKSIIQKGKDLENYVAHQIEAKGLSHARRSVGSGSGNREKSDIDTGLTLLGRNAGIECKNHARPCVGQWWKQAEKLSKLYREPIVIYKLKNETYEESKAIIYLDTLLDLIKASKQPRTMEETDNRELRYLLSNTKNNLNKLLKYLEGKQI